MGRLVVLASERKLDLQFIFMYPLTPVPLSMFHIDGTMAKTDKSALLSILEGKMTDVQSTSPQASAYIVDGQYLLHTLPPNLPSTYGGLARSILVQVVALCSKEVHLISDDYQSVSLKDVERGRRGNDASHYLITGPEQKRPSDLKKALKSSSFKKELPKFLAQEWRDPTYAQLLGTCRIYLDIPNEVLLFRVTHECVEVESVEALISNHVEADTKICLHALEADTNYEDGAIVVRAHDTDIAVILLHHCSKFKRIVLMDVGTASKRDRRFINISEIYRNLGPALCSALVGFHAFTGCDFTSAFIRKGKKKPFALLLKSTDTQEAFRELATCQEVNEKTKRTLQLFVAANYGARGFRSLNEHRFQVFQKAYGPKALSAKPLQKLKGITASSIPPCEVELDQNLQRAAFVSQI